MKAVVFRAGAVELVERELPVPGAGETLVHVRLAGICGTDLEILDGYAGFAGVPGHEFVGECQVSPERRLVAQRVVGEINAGCGRCAECATGDSRHCAERTVLGIVGRDGAFAEFLTLPARNLHVVPPSVEDVEAVFTEPLAAALAVLEQVHVDGSTRVAVLGDGRLANLCAQVLRHAGAAPRVLGKHADKLAVAERLGLDAALAADDASAGYDVVVEATGRREGLERALDRVRPRGTVVLKSTLHEDPTLPTARVVVDEIRLVGSRCGRLAPALELLRERRVEVRPLVGGLFPLADAAEAFAAARRPDVVKVLLANPRATRAADRELAESYQKGVEAQRRKAEGTR